MDENDPITFAPLSPLVEWSYENPIFKEKDANHMGDFAESSHVIKSLTECLKLACRE
ncbi:hypothetical protein SLEP1_g22363 [Rubroshorea leprosula]|uniref:Uncharacterized protein n=1 Tax=Rubroshorea leprosula TaxID=152421 RepID=A0AAV5J8Z1_9ROSI|nr:hypothetical protein SLEP1_g22363 [Rubroshorea leprosula]